MIVAVEPLDATWKMIFFGAAVVLAAGLGCFVFPFFWDALAAS